MRLLNIFAALSGLVALTMLVYAAHGLTESAASENIERIKIAAFIQMGSAAAALAVANRSGKLNLIAGALILLGAALFAGTLYVYATLGVRSVTILAPVGGITLLAGWLTLAFTKPGGS
jgi:uncharacterized membrane protein YgdD (TMEM256/DUF423 family)